MSGLASCAGTPKPVIPPVEFSAPDIEPNILTCEFAPVPPGPGASEAEAEVYKAQLFAAWESCFGNLYAVGNALNAWRVSVGLPPIEFRDAPR